MICDHDWIFQHVVYSDGYQLPGSSAKERVYEDAYYCKKCLDMQYKHQRVAGNNYVKPIDGSVPK